jgi:DNA-directed RNA polymerase subunit RPC12/RpoP
MKEANQRLDALTQRLIDADQTGRGIEPLAIADEIGHIRQLLASAPAVKRAEGGDRHWRCEECGTIFHGDEAPASCAECGRENFFLADLEQPNVESAGG